MKDLKKRFRAILIPAALTGLLLSSAWLALAGPYAVSSHGSATTGVNRSSMDAKYNTSIYGIGNCGHCHEAHASLVGTEPVPVGGGPSKDLAFGVEQTHCFACHDGAPAANNIQASFNKTFKHGKNGSAGTDHMATYDNRHKPGESSSTAFASANRHAECADCHNPHKATDANPLLGASGITPGATAAWGSPTFTGPTEIANASEQYKVCYKCHSNWAGTGTGTNQAQQFNTANRGYHNIEGQANPPSSDTYGNFNPTYVYKMMPRYSGWGTATANNSTMNTNLRNAAMRCSDCHGDTDLSAQGIHGSAVRPILKVPVGSPYNKWDSTVAINNRTDCWCFNCHDPNFTNSAFSNSGGNNWHTEKHNKSEAKCMSCHVKIPHGWNDLRGLLKQKNLAAGPYQGTTTSSGIGYAAGATLPNRGAWTEGNSHNGSLGHQNCN